MYLLQMSMTIFATLTFLSRHLRALTVGVCSYAYSVWPIFIVIPLPNAAPYASTVKLNSRASSTIEKINSDDAENESSQIEPRGMQPVIKRQPDEPSSDGGRRKNKR